METSFDCIFRFADTCNKTTSTCKNTDGSYQCECKRGYGGDECKDINECEEVRCLNGGDCKNSDGSFQCLCPNGFTSMQGLICYSVKVFLITAILNIFFKTPKLPTICNKFDDKIRFEISISDHP